MHWVNSQISWLFISQHGMESLASMVWKQKQSTNGGSLILCVMHHYCIIKMRQSAERQRKAIRANRDEMEMEGRRESESDTERKQSDRVGEVRGSMCPAITSYVSLDLINPKVKNYSISPLTLVLPFPSPVPLLSLYPSVSLHPSLHRNPTAGWLVIQYEWAWLL